MSQQVKCPACDEPTLTEHCPSEDFPNANCHWWKCINPTCQAQFDPIEGRGHTLTGASTDWRGNTTRVYLDRDDKGVWRARNAS